MVPGCSTMNNRSVSPGACVTNTGSVRSDAMLSSPSDGTLPSAGAQLRPSAAPVPPPPPDPVVVPPAPPESFVVVFVPPLPPASAVVSLAPSSPASLSSLEHASAKANVEQQANRRRQYITLVPNEKVTPEECA